MGLLETIPTDPARWQALLLGPGMTEHELGRGPGFCDLAWVWEPPGFVEGELPLRKCVVQGAVDLLIACRDPDYRSWYTVCPDDSALVEAATSHRVPWCLYRGSPEPLNEVIGWELL